MKCFAVLLAVIAVASAGYIPQYGYGGGYGHGYGHGHHAVAVPVAVPVVHKVSSGI